jgi:hypothetical protein
LPENKDVCNTAQSRDKLIGAEINSWGERKELKTAHMKDEHRRNMTQAIASNRMRMRQLQATCHRDLVATFVILSVIPPKKANRTRDPATITISVLVNWW